MKQKTNLRNRCLKLIIAYLEGNADPGCTLVATKVSLAVVAQFVLLDFIVAF
jgi:hypothetical protein